MRSKYVLVHSCGCTDENKENSQPSTPVKLQPPMVNYSKQFLLKLIFCFPYRITSLPAQSVPEPNALQNLLFVTFKFGFMFCKIMILKQCSKC